MNLSDLLAEFGRSACLGALALDDRGLCRLRFDGRLVVDLELDADTGRLHVYSVLGAIPAEGREALYEEMLSANLFGQDTGGAVLAIDALQGEVLLCRTLEPEGLDVRGLTTLIGGFVDQVERWQERLARQPSQAAPAAKAELPPASAAMMLRA